jgi:hypothetical protein
MTAGSGSSGRAGDVNVGQLVNAWCMDTELLLEQVYAHLWQ